MSDDIVSFTGSREERTTIPQILSLIDVIWDAFGKGCYWLSHGEAVGADKIANSLAHRAGMLTISHPWTGNKDANGRWRKFQYIDKRMEPKDDAIERDHDIVDEGKFLIAMPHRSEYLHSVTWATVRYARRIHKPRVIVWPDGKVEWE
jgi:hypothetical protein